MPSHARAAHGALEELCELGPARGWRRCDGEVEDPIGVLILMGPQPTELFARPWGERHPSAAVPTARHLKASRHEVDGPPVDVHRWDREGIPFKVKADASALALEKNQDRDPDDELDFWSCLHLIDYQKILTQNNDLWTRLFSKQYTRPGEEKLPGGWKKRSDWIGDLNKIRNKIDHEYAVTEEEYEFLVSLTIWLVQGQAENDL